MWVMMNSWKELRYYIRHPNGTVHDKSWKNIGHVKNHLHLKSSFYGEGTRIIEAEIILEETELRSWDLKDFHRATKLAKKEKEKLLKIKFLEWEAEQILIEARRLRNG